MKRWCTALIYTIHKKGNENLKGICRGIALLDIDYKIMTSLIAGRLSEKLERKKKLWEVQAVIGKGEKKHRADLRNIIRYATKFPLFF